MNKTISISLLFLTWSLFAKAENPTNTDPTKPAGTVKTVSVGLDLDDFDFDKKKKKKKKKDSDFPLFKHYAGASYFMAPSTATEFPDNKAQGFALSYYPSVQIVDLDFASLRLGFSPSIFFRKFSSREGSGGLLFDFPATLELHLGNPEKGRGMNGLIGAGYGYSRIELVGNNLASGPYFTAGLNWLNYGFRGSYMHNTKGGTDEFGYPHKNVIALTFTYGFF